MDIVSQFYKAVTELEVWAAVSYRFTGLIPDNNFKGGKNLAELQIAPDIDGNHGTESE